MPRSLARLALILPIVLAGSISRAASFDCEAPELKPDEKAICDTRALNDADVRMVTTFEILSSMLAMGARGTLQDEQTAWLAKRQACEADIPCIAASYQDRMQQFTETFKTINKPL